MPGERQEQRGFSPEHDAFVSKYSKEIFKDIVANPRTWINPDYKNKVGTVVAYIKELQREQEKDPNTKLEDLEDQKEWLDWFHGVHGVMRRKYPEIKSIRDLRNTNMGSYTEYLREDIRTLQERQRSFGKFEGQNTDIDLSDVVNDINRKSVDRLDEISSELLDILYKKQITKDDIKRVDALHKEIKQLAPSR